jgi:peptidoglycan/LPS O-acetylase OafA/YrhL
LGKGYGGGEIAVELFFIISGFYMALILNEKYNTSDKTIVFYKNRFLKLFPIYWTILFLTISLFLVLNKGGVLEHIINNLSNLGFFSIYVLFSNIFLIGEDLLMFLGFNGDSIIFTKSFSDTDMPFHKFIIVPQSWTLSLEIMFYLMAPFIARRSIKLLVSLFSLSIFIKIGLWNIGFINDPWSYRFILSELSFFFIGMIMYKVYKFGLYSKIIGNKSLFFIGLSLFLVSGYFYYDLKTILDFNEVDTFKYMIYFLFILFLPLLFVQTKDNKVDRYIGELSYPVYIVHIFVIMFVSKIANDTNLSLLAIIGSILFSIVLNKFIQERVEKIRMKNLKEKN